MKLRCHDWSNPVRSMMKTRQDDDIIDHTGVVYAKNKTKLSWPIKPTAFYDENHIGKWCDWTYRCDLQENDIELSSLIGLGVVCNENQTRQLHGWSYKCGIYQKWNWGVMIDQTRCGLCQKQTKLSWPIKPTVFCDENHIGKWCDWTYSCGLQRKWYWTIVIDRIKCRLWWKPDRTTSWLIEQVWSMLKMIMNFHDRSDRVLTMTKTR